MIGDLRSFFERATVVELVLGFAFATTVVSVISALVDGLVVAPIRSSGGDESGPLDAVIAGRAFEFAYILQTGLVLIAVTLIAAVVLRRADEALWEEGATRSCPHCLSEIPGEASVCSYCTRDVPAAA
jgi:large conductance mechanosensitive channel